MINETTVMYSLLAVTLVAAVFAIHQRLQLMALRKDIAAVEGVNSKAEDEFNVNSFLSDILMKNKGMILSFFTHRISPECYETLEPLKYQRLQLPHPKSYEFEVHPDHVLIRYYMLDERKYEDRIYGAPNETYVLVKGDGRQLSVTFTEDDAYISDTSILLISEERLNSITLKSIETLVHYLKSNVTVSFEDKRGPMVLKYRQFRLKKNVIGDGYKLLLGDDFKSDADIMCPLEAVSGIYIEAAEMMLVPSVDGTTFFKID